LLVVSLVTYAFVYPDIVDLIGGRLQFGFRLNNGIVVKDWIARWNTVHASTVIEGGRPHGSGVLILGYWLPVWRYGLADVTREHRLPDGTTIDRTLNAAFRTNDGTWVVHVLDQAEAARLSAKGFRLAFGEGVDAFLRDVYGYDVKSYGAVTVPVRVLGEGVAEHFILFCLVECAVRHRPGEWGGCLERANAEPASPRKVPTASLAWVH